jgi:hypothetical protein
MSKEMLLEKLYMHRSYKGDTVTGNIEFKGEHGSIEITLNDDSCKKILLACADALIQTSKEVANKLSIDIIESVEYAKLEKKDL